MPGSAVGTRNSVLDLVMDFHSPFLPHNPLFSNSSIHLLTTYFLDPLTYQLGSPQSFFLLSFKDVVIFLLCV